MEYLNWTELEMGLEWVNTSLSYNGTELQGNEGSYEYSDLYEVSDYDYEAELGWTSDPIVLKLYLLFDGFGVTVVGILGIIFNILSIIIFLQPQMRSLSINILLVGVQISDLVFVCTQLFRSVGIIVHHYAPGDWADLFVAIYEYIVPTGLLALFASHYFTILVSLERYVAVSHPLKVKVLCTTRRAIVASIAVVTIAILVTSHRWPFIVYIVGQCVNCNTHLMIMEIVLFHLVPFLALLLLNVAIYLGYRKSQNGVRSIGTTHNKEDNSITVLLMSIVLLYLACNSLHVLHYITSFMGISTRNSWFLSFVTAPQKELFLAINSASNFILYCAFGKKFRTELRKWLTCERDHTGGRSSKNPSHKIQSACSNVPTSETAVDHQKRDP